MKLTIWRMIMVTTITLVTATPGHAQQTFTSNSIFSQQGLSIWNSGPAFTLDTGNQFLGEQWNVGNTFGGIDQSCFLGVCASFGAAVGAQTSGKVGLDYSLNVNSGSFGLLYPGATSITVPTSLPVLPDGGIAPITVGTQFTGVSSLPTNSRGGTAQATLQVTGPTLQASLGLEAQASVSALAQVCVVTCFGPSFGPYSFDASQNLLNINPKNDGTVSVLGTTVSANQNVSFLDGLANASLQIPNLDSSSAATPGGVSNGVLTAAKRDNILALNANIAQIVGDAVGLPIPLSGNDGSFGYNILQANAGVGLDVSQTLQFKPTTTGALVFSEPVTPIVNGVAGALTNRINFNYGNQVSFVPSSSMQDLSFTPITDLIGDLHNTTDLVVDGNVNVKALGLNIAGLTVGPLVDASLPSFDIGAIPLLDQSFTDNFGSLEGTPVTLNFSCGSHYGGEFPETNVCASSKIVDIGTVDTSGPISVDEYVDEDCAAYTYLTNNGDPGPTSCKTTFDHFGSYINTPDGPIDVSTLSTLALNPLDPGVSTTDAGDLALLASLGYTGAPSSFDIPVGAPLSSFAVPEPSSMLAFSPAAALLLLLRLRRRPNATRWQALV